MSWNPVTHPYIVRVSRQANRFNSNIGEAHETLESAMAVCDVPLKAGEIRRFIDKAVNGETWTKNGRWVMVFTRERKKK